MNDSKKQIKLISWNVNGLRAVMTKDFIKTIRLLSPDILMIQETKLQEEQRTPDMIQLLDYKGYWSYSTIKKGYSGVASFARLNPGKVTTAFGKPEFDQEGRVIQMDFEAFTLFNVYFPNGAMSDERLRYKMEFFAWFLDYAKGLRKKGRRLIITGDFNIAHNEIDLKNPGPNSDRSGFLRIERDILDAMTADGYIDTFRYFYPDEVKYSWWSYRFSARKNNAGWRIDYFFVTKDMLDHGLVVDAFIYNDIFGSDHCPVGLTLNF